MGYKRFITTHSMKESLQQMNWEWEKPIWQAGGIRKVLMNLFIEL